MARSFNRYSSGKSINITYSECVFVELGILHAMRLLLIVIRGPSVYRIFFHSLIKGTFFLKKKVIEHKMCVVFLCTTFIYNVSHSKKK